MIVKAHMRGRAAGQSRGFDDLVQCNVNNVRVQCNVNNVRALTVASIYCIKNPNITKKGKSHHSSLPKQEKYGS